MYNFMFPLKHSAHGISNRAAIWLIVSIVNAGTGRDPLDQGLMKREMLMKWSENTFGGISK